MSAEDARRARRGWYAIGLGCALIVAGTVATGTSSGAALSAGGYFAMYGAILAGIASIVRGACWLNPNVEAPVDPLPGAEVVAPRRRSLALELALVAVVSGAVLIPGIGRYTLVDPWETHYGEVSRMMLQNNDWVHTDWPQDGEGFRSKPILQFWMMSAGMRAVGLADNGGYSGEMVHDARTMIAIRLPFIVSAIAGLMLMWWMLARLVSRRVAWLGLLIVGSSPMFCLIARNAIPDMPMVACTIGAMALFTMAVEDGERPILPLARFTRWRVPIDARHVVLGLAGAFIVIQAIYYFWYFLVSPQLAIRGPILNPALWLPLLMLLGLGAMSRDGWLIIRLPFVIVGCMVGVIRRRPLLVLTLILPVALIGNALIIGISNALFVLVLRVLSSAAVIAWIVIDALDQPPPPRVQTWWRAAFDNTLYRWDRYALDRVALRCLVFGADWLLFAVRIRPQPRWADPSLDELPDRLLRMTRITTMRQVYLLGCYALLGVSVLAKGPPGLGVVGGVGVLHVVLRGKWRALYDGEFELKRGLILMVVVFMPWHIAMFLKDGLRFIDEYLFTHILNRAAVGVDNSPGTFEYYISQIGHGMWLWAALLPAAFGAALLRSRLDTREARVRFMMALWAIVATTFFCLVQTKFHHYILPALPPLALLVAFWLDDIVAKRDRLHPLYAALGIGIVLLICRDLMYEPERWIEMFVFRYDRPWPSNEPWSIDPSDGFLVLGIVAAVALVIAATRFRRIGLRALAAAGLAICVWSLQVYMPLAGTHWGMGDAVRTYYKQRTIYGEKIVYFGGGEFYDEWHDLPKTWSFDTIVPDRLMIGQPMTIAIQVASGEPDHEKTIDQELSLIGAVSALGDHSVEVTFQPIELRKLADPLARFAKGPRGRPPIRAVDADRLIAWQLYWRGENFWSGDEIVGWLPEMKTAFAKSDNTEFNKYINDRVRAPIGRRYFLITEAGKITSPKSMLPTQRGRETYEVIDTTSNKFSLASFWL